MQYQTISAKLNEYDNYRLHLVAQTTIEKVVKPLPIILDHLDILTKEIIYKDLNKDSKEFYIIYDYRIAELMKQFGEPISDYLIYPIWQRTYTNDSILEDLIFQKIYAHTIHNIAIEELI
jgi:hypothetical protein